MLNDQHKSIRLRDVFPGADFYPAGADPRFAAVRTDPDAVAPGDLFVLLDEFDSTDAVAALARGASAVVADRLLPIPEAPQAVVEDSQAALRRLRTEATKPRATTEQVAFVGSLGAESAATTLAAILASRGRAVGLLTDACDDDGEHCLPRDASDPVGVAQWRRRCELGGVATTVIQATPDTPLDEPPAVLCVTSLRCDGLTAEGERRWPAIASHRAALRDCVRLAEFRGVLVVNADDPDGLHLASEHAGRVVAFGESDAADLRIVPIESCPGEQTMLVACGAESACVTIPTAGRAARRDAAAAIATAVALGTDLHVAASGLSLAGGCPSHLRPVFAGQDYGVFTDTAVRPLELADALDGAAASSGRLLAVVRLADAASVAREQVAVAGKIADRVFAYGESAASVATPANVTVVDDPLAAMAVAIGLAEPPDTVLVAGASDYDRDAAAKLVRRRLECEDRRAAA